jgi:hypothetical protein
MKWGTHTLGLISTFSFLLLDFQNLDFYVFSSIPCDRCAVQARAATFQTPKISLKKDGQKMAFHESAFARN